MESFPPPQSPSRIAVVMTWPELKNAEYENVQRIIRAGSAIGVDIVVVNNDGYVIWDGSPVHPSNSYRISKDDVNFVISLHFESPKFYDIYSYAALWNPLQFYFDWGYDKSSRHLATHDDAISCDSRIADSHAIGLWRGLGRPLPTPLPRIFHSVGETIPPEFLLTRKLFYVGINWERINGQIGRHHNLLLELDRLKLVDIYGPELFHGKKVWDGFDGYKGSIPFDGHSTLRRISEAGICLVFSSAAHQKSAIMSNRLFEGLSAGAVVIANRHAIVDKYLKEVAYIVDDSRSSDEVTRSIVEIIRDINADPQGAYERAVAGQRIFESHFELKNSLQQLVQGHSVRARELSTTVQAHSTPRVDVILNYCGLDVKEVEDSVRNVLEQKHVDVTLHLIIDGELFSRHESRLLELLHEFTSHFVYCAKFYDSSFDLGDSAIRRENSGPYVASAIKRLRGEYFAIRKADETWFSDHLSRLARALQDRPSALASGSGCLIENLGDHGRPTRRLECLAQTDWNSLIYANQIRYSGQVLFNANLSALIPADVFELLDLGEHNIFLLEAFLHSPLASTQAATYVFLEHREALQAPPIINVEHQHQVIRDLYASDDRWLALTGGYANARIHRFAGSPIDQRVSTQISMGDAHAISMGETYNFGLNGVADKFAVDGLSSPEATWTWVEGERALFEFRLPPGDADLLLELDVHALPGASQQQRLWCFFNGQAVGYQPVGDTIARLRYNIDGRLRTAHGISRLMMSLSYAERPAAQPDATIDSRSLSLCLRAIRVSECGAREDLGASPDRDISPKPAKTLKALFSAFDR